MPGKNVFSFLNNVRTTVWLITLGIMFGSWLTKLSVFRWLVQYLCEYKKGLLGLGGDMHSTDCHSRLSLVHMMVFWRRKPQLRGKSPCSHLWQLLCLNCSKMQSERSWTSWQDVCISSGLNLWSRFGARTSWIPDPFHLILIYYWSFSLSSSPLYLSINYSCIVLVCI